MLKILSILWEHAWLLLIPGLISMTYLRVLLLTLSFRSLDCVLNRYLFVLLFIICLNFLNYCCVWFRNFVLIPVLIFSILLSSMKFINLIVVYFYLLVQWLCFSAFITHIFPLSHPIWVPLLGFITSFVMGFAYSFL